VPYPDARARYSEQRTPAQIFGIEHTEALMNEVGLKPTLFATTATLAASLNRAADMLFYGHTMATAASSAKERKEWLRDLKKRTHMLLAKFGMELDGTTPHPASHAIEALLFNNTIFGGLTNADRDEEAWRDRWAVALDDAWRIRCAMRPPEDLVHSPSIPGVMPLDHQEGLRSAVMGVAYLAQLATAAEALYEAVAASSQNRVWVRGVKHTTSALLANFGMEIDGTAPGPSSHAIRVLLRSEFDCDDLPKTGGSAAEWCRWREVAEREALRLRLAMGSSEWPVHTLVIPETAPLPAGMPTHREAIRSALTGIQYIAKLAAFAEALYANRTKHPKRFTYRNTYFLCLTTIYWATFAKKLTYTTRVDGAGEPEGAIIRFCQAVSRFVREYTDSEAGSMSVHTSLRQQLFRWANSPRAVLAALIDLDRMDPEQDVWRRHRDGKMRLKARH
jgi:hypothetical protein